MTGTENKKTEAFDAFAHDDWWSPKGKLFALHRINPLRFEYFSSIAGALSGKTVVDVGCGGGILAESFAKAGAVVTGVDLSTKAIDSARSHAEAGSLTIDYRLTSVEELAKVEPRAFDIVVCAEVLEHVDDLEGFLSHTVKLLKPGGLFFFGTINKTIKARFLAIFMAEDILRMVPPGTHDYNRFVRPSVLAEFLDTYGVEIKDLKGLTYDPLKFEFKVGKDTSVNYMGYAVKAGA